MPVLSGWLLLGVVALLLRCGAWLIREARPGREARRKLLLLGSIVVLAAVAVALFMVGLTLL
ncbi:MAG: hypothetical protein QOE90_2344 [Thermoplasmata archaeon]|jgi:hypothetical protein|nr:hypothetical protein [Thermoplasmata archaeon]